MHLDVLDLRNFYYRTGLGRAAQKAVRDQMQRLWPDANGQTVVGYGFAVPLLRPYLARSARVIGLMPAPQGVMPWPPGMANVSVLCEETLWPIPTGQTDKLVVMHGLETSENQSRLLQECHRVLAPAGKALFVVPNRGGLWARSDKTPFGHGRPYSLSQLQTQLRRHAFLPERHAAALFQPPSERRFWMKAGPFWERTGRRISARFAGGVLLVEARQQDQPRPKGLAETVRRPLRVLEAMTKPEAKPV